MSSSKSRDLRPLGSAILMGLFGAAAIAVGENDGIGWMKIAGGCAVGISFGALLSMFGSKS